MNFYFIKTPKFIRSFYKEHIWCIDTDKKEIYLTFDDGPTPIVTNFVLDELIKHEAKATFFCIGKNIENHPELFNRIILEGHSIGNHTHNHENGWKSDNSIYLDSISRCQSSLSKTQYQAKQLLFRPPYGKVKNSLAKKIIKRGYKIIMWTVLSGDFDTKITKEKCLKNVIENTKKGDIIVFHDSKKAFEKMQYALPKTLEYFSKKGFEFKFL